MARMVVPNGTESMIMSCGVILCRKRGLSGISELGMKTVVNGAKVACNGDGP
jgi:hypothetical protein